MAIGIRHNSFHFKAFLFSAVIAGMLCDSSLADITKPKKSRPNFIIVFADDLGYGDLGCYGHPTIATPQLDRMAGEGQRWTNFYVAAAVCSPSRVAAMTGHFPERYRIDQHFAWVSHQVKANMPDWLDPNAPLLPKILHDVGYATGDVRMIPDPDK